MFKNEYQGGPYFEIFSTQGRDSTSHWKIGPTVKKVYEKEVKGYVYVLEGTPSTTKIHVPKDNKQSMTLVQRFLVLQICLNKGQDFSMELGVCDLSNNKRRIQLSTAQKETQITPLHARIPLCLVRRAVWLNLCLDMVSLVGETWSGQTYRAIDHITVSANCKLRRIFTMKSQPPDTTDDNELYGCQYNTGEVELIPKQVQLAPDIVQFTQVLSMSKIKNAERVKNGKGLVLAEQIQPGSMLELDLNTSGNKGNFHIAFGSKVNVPTSETSRRSARLGSTTNRSLRSTLSRADGGYGSGSMRDLRDSVGSQDGLMTARSGVKDVVKRPSKAGMGGGHPSTAVYGRQISEPVTQEEQDTVTVNGVSHSHLVTPHPPREPSNDRVRRYHRVKTVPSNNVALSHSNSNSVGPGGEVNTTKDRVSSAGSITEEAVTDSGIASKATSSPSSAARSDHSAVVVPGQARGGSGDSLRRQAVGRHSVSASVTNSSHQFGAGREARDSLSDVIALLRAEGPPPRGKEAGEEEHSSDSGTESSQPGEYEESDDEGSSDTTNKLHLFVSRPMLAPRRNLSPSTSDQDPNKRSHLKAMRSNVRRSTSEIISSRGARPEDDFHSGMTSSDEDDNYHKPRPGSRPHSGTSATGSPKTRGGSSLVERAGQTKGRMAGMPKVSISPDFKRPPFNPTLYASPSSNSRGEANPRQTPVRRSRKSLREIKPHLEESARHSKASDNSYDHTKYQMAEVTESFEARMFASMKRQEEEELEDVLPPPHGALGTHSLPPHPPRAGPIVRASQQVCSESPYTTSDDDTSFSTWKAPAPNQMAHNYQDEMKSRLSSDTLTSSNPRDWSSVFSPPIILPSDRDLQGTLEGQFEDLNDAGLDAHTSTTGPSTSEDDELDLMFDPNLNCYYDPKTLKYYELAT